MTFVPTEDCAVAVIEQGLGSDLWTNTLWFEKEDFDQAALDTLADWLHVWWAAEVMPYVMSVWSLTKVTVYGQNSPTDLYAVDSEDPVFGERGGTVLALNVALCVTFRTATRGRSGRGRNYLAGMSELDVNQDAVTDPAMVLALATSFYDLVDDVSAIDWEWVVVQKFSAGVPLTAGVARPVTSAEIRSNIISTQRRRISRP